MHLGLTKSRDDKLLQDLLDKKLRVIVIFEDDYLNHIARIAYKDIQQDNYTYRIGEYNIYKEEEWGFCDFCKRHDCYFIVPNEIIEGGISEIPNDLGEAAWDCVLDSVDVNNPVLLPKYKELLIYLFIAGAKWQKEQMMKDYPKWRRIKAGERLPCPAYVWTIVYDNYPDCFEGRLMPNIQGVKVGRDTWYLPVDVIHNLPKED